MINRGILCCAVALVTGMVVLGVQGAEGPDRDVRPNGKGIGTLQHPPTPDQAANPEAKGGKPGGGGGGGGRPKSNGIDYHGGPVMNNGVKMYYIWYGAWGTTSATQILEGLAQNIGHSPYYHINTTYASGTGAVTDDVFFGGATTVSAYLGNSLSDSAIAQIVYDAINSGALSLDDNGVYFVLTSQEVTASSGFCTVYCGWHTAAYMTFSSQHTIKYAFIGNPDRCPSACEAQQGNSPNGNPGADAMASIIAHELEEAATDPELNAWYDRRGYENADKCAWTFGTTYTAPNGTVANMHLGSRDYLIQQNWVNNNGGYCAVSY